MRTINEKLHRRRKAEIMAAATTCFAKKGIRQTTMQEICESANLSPGALYRYYSGKDKIITALAASENEVNEQLLDYLRSQKNIVQALRDALPDIIATVSEPAVSSITVEIVSEAARNPVVANEFLKVENKFKDGLACLLQNGKKEGFVDEDVNVRAFVHLFTKFLDAMSGAFVFPMDISKDQLARSLDHLIFRTLTPAGSLK